MCYTPLSLKATGRQALRSRTMLVPCGKCYECLMKRSKAWTLRLLEEAKVSSSCCFLTLTYEEAPLTKSGLPTLVREEFPNFMKRLRLEAQKGIKYYACGEYGSQTFRPHYHAIMFNSSILDQDKLTGIWMAGKDKRKRGFVHVGSGSAGSFAYVTKYIIKNIWEDDQPIVDEETGEVFEDDRVKPFSLMSKYLGYGFLTKQMIKYMKDHQKASVPLGGFETSIPRYWKEKVFDESERFVMAYNGQKILDNRIIEKFNDDPVLEGQWKKDQIRKHKKIVNQKRNKL